MLKKNSVKMLTQGYNYYESIRHKTDEICKSKLYTNNEFDYIVKKEKLYNLILNLCNQIVYDYTYVFTMDDFDFIYDNNIDVKNILEIFTDDIIRMKSIENKSKSYLVLKKK